MELQGKKATHDFLSLYTKDSSLQVQDSRSPSQGGRFLKTHDFLQPLERSGAGVATEAAAAGGPGAAVEGSFEHVLPGGIGTYSISHVSDPRTRAVVVKSEFGGKCDAARGAERRDCGSQGYSYHNGSSSSSYAGGSASAMPFALWEQSAPKDSASRGPSWPSSAFAARGSAGLGSPASSAARSHSAPEKKRFMESASRSSRCFDDDDDDDEDFGKRETSSFQKELTIKVDGKSSGSGTDQRPNTPRSKHSATEQRRRSKINDRFQILRELIPHSDQKRDKASFLLEVIEYIRFLQEKVQKYESSYPGWNQDNSKLMPWVKVYFRSFWKNATNSSHCQAPGDGISDLSQDMKNGSTAPGYMFSGKFDDNNILVPPAMIPCAQNHTESDMTAGISYKATETTSNVATKVAATPYLVQPNAYPLVGTGTGAAPSQQRLVSDADNLASQAHPDWLRPSDPADCTVSSEMSHEQEELTIDEGTISVSSAYSQGMLTTLTQALQSSGIDLSQASISVQINLGKRAVHKRPTAAATTSCAKDHEQSRAGSSGEESSRASKKRKLDYS